MPRAAKALLLAALCAWALDEAEPEPTAEDVVSLLQTTLRLSARPALVAPRGAPSDDVLATAAALTAVRPGDTAALRRGCEDLAPALTRESGDEVEPLLHAVDTATTALVKGPRPDPAAAMACIFAQVGPAPFNRNFTLLLNRTTHVLDNIITLLRDNPDDRYVNEQMLSTIAGAATYVAPELTPYVDALGGFDVLFSALEHFTDAARDANVMMSAWRGLSDHSHDPTGAAIIAHHGGHNRGLAFMLDHMRAHPEPGYAEGPDHLTLKYEILQNVLGVLEDDSSNAYGAALLDLGLVREALAAMRLEPSFRGTQDVGCRVLSTLLGRNPSIAADLAERNATGTARAAVAAFNETDATPWFGTTLGAAYPVVAPCRELLAGVPER